MVSRSGQTDPAAHAVAAVSLAGSVCFWVLPMLASAASESSRRAFGRFCATVVRFGGCRTNSQVFQG